MLHLEYAPGQFRPWFGERINGIRHPRNIATLWTPAELAAVGLYDAVDPPIPPGEEEVSRTVQRVAGVVTIVRVTQPIPPPTQAEIDAELDSLTQQVDQGRSLMRALAKKIYQLEKATNSTLTVAEFKQSVRADLAAMQK